MVYGFFMANRSVRVGSVKISVYPWRNSRGVINYRFTFRDSQGKRKDVTRSTQDAAIRAARDQARQIHNGNTDLGNLSDDQTRMVRAILALNPTWQDIEKLTSMIRTESRTVSEAVIEFLELKRSNKGRSNDNIRTLSALLSKLTKEFEEKDLNSITAKALNQWMITLPLSPRSKKNLRGAIVTLFRWARSMSYLPDATTEAERNQCL